MIDRRNVVVLSGTAELNELPNPACEWSGRIDEDRTLVFTNAYSIERKDWSHGIENCVYRVHDREFTDLSCMSGKTLQKYSDGSELREHEDGTVFLFSRGSIPTFDSGDREWDSMSLTALCCDSEGVTLIRCCRGYKIPKITIYTGLRKTTREFTEWLNRLPAAEKGLIPSGSLA